MSKKKLLTGVLSFSPLLMMAQDNARGILNSFLSDWLLPVFVLFVIAGIVHGIIRNQRNVVDNDEEGTVFKGFKNVGIMVAFYTLAFAVLLLIVAGANEVINQIRVN